MRLFASSPVPVSALAAPVPTTKPRPRLWVHAAVVLTLFMSLLVSAGPTGAQESDPVERDWTALAEMLETASLAPDFPGGGLIVVDRDEGVVYQDAYGDFTTDRISMIASSSKPISAGILMSLHQDGILDIDDPVSEITGWTGVQEGLTPRNLISASSGLRGLRPDFLYGPYLCQWAVDWTLEDCGRQIATTTGDDEDVVPPGTDYRYGGGAWMVAGAVAEVASGKSWNELFTQYVAEPCGLENSGYQSIVAMGSFGGYPYGFAGDPTLHPEHANPTIEGGMYATTADYAKILLMHLRGGVCENERVFTEENTELLHTSQIYKNGNAGDGYAMGWHVEDDIQMLQSNGLWGAYPWINHEHGYAAFWSFEGDYDASRTVRDEMVAEVHRVMTEENQIGLFDAPTVTPDGGLLDPSATVMVDPDGTGELWYTTDGSDPVDTVGNPSPSAALYSDPIADAAAAVAVRVRERSQGGEWSRMSVAQFEMLGDSNCDGSATIVDALVIAQFAVGTRSHAECPLADPITELDAVSGDFDRDGTTDIVDALLIARCAVGVCD